MESPDFRPIYYDAFISYKRKGGSVWGELLRSVLTYKFGLRIWFDVIDIAGGEWKPQVVDAISKSQYVIAIFYKGWDKHLEKCQDKDEFLFELKKAHSIGLKIIPFFTNDYSLGNLARSKIAPSWLKELFYGPHSHNSIVKYCHTAINETYYKLGQQLSGTKLVLRINITPTSNCEILSIKLNDREAIKESLPINGGCFNLDRTFNGVVEILYRKVSGSDCGQILSQRIGIRKKKSFFDSDVCDDYWDKSDIDIDIDNVLQSDKPLHYDVIFDWNHSMNKNRCISAPPRSEALDKIALMAKFVDELR